MSPTPLSASRTRTFTYIASFLAAGHLFDLSLGVGWNESVAWFGAITDLYANWDPMYIAQPFYMEITSLLSGFVMIPMTLLLAWGFHKRRTFVNWLAPMYAGFIVANNLGWYWNEYFCPEPPISWFMLIFWSAPWWIFPSWLAWSVIQHPITAGDVVEARATGQEAGEKAYQVA